MLKNKIRICKVKSLQVLRSSSIVYWVLSRGLYFEVVPINVQFSCHPEELYLSPSIHQFQRHLYLITGFHVLMSFTIPILHPGPAKLFIKHTKALTKEALIPCQNWLQHLIKIRSMSQERNKILQLMFFGSSIPNHIAGNPPKRDCQRKQNRNILTFGFW